MRYSQIHRDKKQRNHFQGLGEEENGELVFTGYGISVWEGEESSGDGWW